MSKHAHKLRTPGSLKEATLKLVAACGGRKKSALYCRVSETQLGKYTDDDPQFDGVFMPIDIVAALEAKCGEPIVTRFLALQRDALVIALPQPGEGPYSEKLAKLSEESGQTFAESARALSDGKMTPREAQSLRGQAVELGSALCGLISDLDGFIAKGHG